MTAKHPRQPVVLDAVGTARFKKNAIVHYLLKHGGLDLNTLHALDFSDQDWEQFVQLIGYSVSGTVNMEYVSTDLWNAAQKEAEALLTPAVQTQAVRHPGCHNRPRPTASTTYTAQAGWREYQERGETVRVPVWVQVPHVMSTECRYDKSAMDAGCAGCQHGEQRPPA